MPKTISQIAAKSKMAIDESMWRSSKRARVSGSLSDVFTVLHPIRSHFLEFCDPVTVLSIATCRANFVDGFDWKAITSALLRRMDCDAERKRVALKIQFESFEAYQYLKGYGSADAVPIDESNLPAEESWLPRLNADSWNIAFQRMYSFMEATLLGQKLLISCRCTFSDLMNYLSSNLLGTWGSFEMTINGMKIQDKSDLVYEMVRQCSSMHGCEATIAIVDIFDIVVNPDKRPRLYAHVPTTTLVWPSITTESSGDEDADEAAKVAAVAKAYPQLSSFVMNGNCVRMGKQRIHRWCHRLALYNSGGTVYQSDAELATLHDYLEAANRSTRADLSWMSDEEEEEDDEEDQEEEEDTVVFDPDASFPKLAALVTQKRLNQYVQINAYSRSDAFVCQGERQSVCRSPIGLRPKSLYEYLVILEDLVTSLKARKASAKRAKPPALTKVQKRHRFSLFNKRSVVTMSNSVLSMPAGHFSSNENSLALVGPSWPDSKGMFMVRHVLEFEILGKPVPSFNSGASYYMPYRPPVVFGVLEPNIDHPSSRLMCDIHYNRPFHCSGRHQEWNLWGWTGERFSAHGLWVTPTRDDNDDDDDVPKPNVFEVGDRVSMILDSDQQLLKFAKNGKIEPVQFVVDEYPYQFFVSLLSFGGSVRCIDKPNPSFVEPAEDEVVIMDV